MTEKECQRCHEMFTAVRSHQKFCGSMAKETGCSYAQSKEREAKWHRDNREHCRENSRKWRSLNPLKVQEKRNRDTLNRYKLTQEDYDNLVKMQNESCAICRNRFEKRPHIDHCHETLKVRGLLCEKCNRGLGHFDDNTDKLSRAIRYVTSST